VLAFYFLDKVDRPFPLAIELSQSMRVPSHCLRSACIGFDHIIQLLEHDLTAIAGVRDH